MKPQRDLLGYVTGVVDYWMESRDAGEDGFFDYLKVALRETGFVSDDEIRELLSRFGEFSSDADFWAARANGRKTPVERPGRLDGGAPDGRRQLRMTALH
jgi:hypothetical protein